VVRIVIGTEPNQFIPQKVLEYSIRANTRADVAIRFETQRENRVGGTNFGFVRFYVPSLFDYAGRAIYLDADQLVFGDVAELERELDGEHAIAVVTRPEGTFGGRPVDVRNQSSVMVLDCGRLRDWDPAHLFDNVIPNGRTPGPGEITYKDFMYLDWVEPAKLQPLDPAWNHFNIVRPDTKLVHFSYVRGQPWKTPSHGLTPVWSDWLRRAMQAGAVTRGDLARAILKRHVHPYFVRFLGAGGRRATAVAV
jgi:hypothetical protein